VQKVGVYCQCSGSLTLCLSGLCVAPRAVVSDVGLRDAPSMVDRWFVTLALPASAMSLPPN